MTGILLKKKMTGICFAFYCYGSNTAEWCIDS